MFYMYCIIVILYVPRHVVRVNKISIYLSWTSFHRSPLNDRIRDSVHFAIVIPALHSRPSERNHIWHTYLDRYRTDSNLFFTHPTPRGDFRGSNIQKSGKCHELPRKSIILKKNPPHPTPPQGVQVGILGG